ncbi:MAG: hypothetical protein EOO09_01585 [Chitinophagaceae bacterium]|nr:MAG: hypothetical protein EOO09_01585 [Chitinophagaceae bacterium]
MRKIFNERSLVVVLFIITLVVFSLASEDARKIEARNLQAGVRQTNPALVDNNTSSHAGARE